jgi:hypothetical protein
LNIEEKLKVAIARKTSWLLLYRWCGSDERPSLAERFLPNAAFLGVVGVWGKLAPLFCLLGAFVFGLNVILFHIN